MTVNGYSKKYGRTLMWRESVLDSMYLSKCGTFNDDGYWNDAVCTKERDHNNFHKEVVSVGT